MCVHRWEVLCSISVSRDKYSIKARKFIGNEARREIIQTLLRFVYNPRVTKYRRVTYLSCGWEYRSRFIIWILYSQHICVFYVSDTTNERNMIIRGIIAVPFTPCYWYRKSKIIIIGSKGSSGAVLVTRIWW